MSDPNKLKTENEKLKSEDGDFRFQFSLFSFQFFRRDLLQLSAVLFVAYVLKYFYSTASVDELRWILTPTAFLVETITGRGFAFESGAGYMSADHTFLIAASCSGVNFLIIAFVMLAFGKCWRECEIEWRYLPVAMLTAYIATILANTVRIIIALSLRDAHVEFAGLTPEGLHRLEGVVVYFGSLLVLFITSETSERSFSFSAVARRAILPLVIYYAVTLGVPIAGGAAWDIEFWKHAIVVLIAPLIVVFPLVILGLAAEARTQ